MQQFSRGAERLALPCALLCCLAASACGTANRESASGPAPADEKAESLAAGEDWVPEERPLHEQWKGDLDGMDKRRILRVLVNLNRSQYFYDGGKPRGLTFEAMGEFESFLNKRLHPKDKTGKERLRIVFVPTTTEKIVRAVADGYGDLAVANLTIDPERKKIVDYSDPTVTDIKQVVITGPGAPAVARLEDLSGKEFYVKKSSTHYRNLEALSESFKKSGKPAIKLTPADEQLEDDDILEMVNAGLVPMTLMDSHVAGLWAQVFKDLKVHSDLVVKAGNQKGWIFRKNSPKLAAAVNEFISKRAVGTSFGNTLVRRYLANAKYAAQAYSPQERRKFQLLTVLFQKYAAKYELDWLMLIAEGYQESKLDHGVRSRVGAVGIMQVMPSTASSPEIRIPNIHKLENNIHAGAKILSILRNEHFNDPAIDPINRQLFASAAYNAGVNRIDRCRELTREMGLDPNVWFGNVEFAVAKKVGRETVQYVGNVYKYYLAYRMSSQRGEVRKEARKSVGGLKN